MSWSEPDSGTRIVMGRILASVPQSFIFSSWLIQSTGIFGMNIDGHDFENQCPGIGSLGSHSSQNSMTGCGTRSRVHPAVTMVAVASSEMNFPDAIRGRLSSTSCIGGHSAHCTRVMYIQHDATISCSCNLCKVTVGISRLWPEVIRVSKATGTALSFRNCDPGNGYVHCLPAL